MIGDPSSIHWDALLHFTPRPKQNLDKHLGESSGSWYTAISTSPAATLEQGPTVRCVHIVNSELQSLRLIP